MRRFRCAAVLLFASLLTAAAARAQVLDTSAEHGLIMDAETGQVLWQKDGMTPMPPASMSKLMTMELLFQRLKDGRVKLTDTFPVSERAWRTQGSKMFVELGSRIPVEDLIRGIIIQSGNDACVVVAEGLGGTVEGFVDHDEQAGQGAGPGPVHFRQSRRPAGPARPADERAGPGQAVAPPDQRLSAILSLFQRARVSSGTTSPSPTATWCWTSCRAPMA